MKSHQLPVLIVILFLAEIACGNQNPLRPADISVLESYQKIYEALTADTIKGVSENASAIAKTVKADGEKKLPIALADEAEKMAKETDLKISRESFQKLSSTLISYLEKQNIKGTGFDENYCPMVKASWLQKGEKMNNPYFGKSMPSCGENKRSF